MKCFYVSQWQIIVFIWDYNSRGAQRAPCQGTSDHWLRDSGMTQEKLKRKKKKEKGKFYLWKILKILEDLKSFSSSSTRFLPSAGSEGCNQSNQKLK